MQPWATSGQNHGCLHGQHVGSLSLILHWSHPLGQSKHLRQQSKHLRQQSLIEPGSQGFHSKIWGADPAPDRALTATG